MRNKRHMLRFFPIFICVFLCASCGSAPRPIVAPTAPESPEFKKAFESGTAAFAAGQFDAAAKFFEKSLKSGPTGTPLNRVQFYQARLMAVRDAGKGSDALLTVAQHASDEVLKNQAYLHGGLAALKARRCMTVRKVIPPILDKLEKQDLGLGALALAQCSEKQEQIKLLAQASEHLTDNPEVEATVQKLLGTLSPDELQKTATRYGDTPLGTFLYGHIAHNARKTGDRKALEDALKHLDVDGAEARAAEAFLARPILGLIIPRSGRTAPIGKRLEANLTAILAQQSEDRPETAFQLKVLDGATADATRSAIETLAAEGFGAVGIFDEATAAAATEAADELNFPLVCMTHSDAPLRSVASSWRALHTPLLVARSAAGAGLHSGGKKALVVHDGTAYGARHAHWFKLSWRAGGGGVADEIKWSDNSPDWQAIAKDIEQRDFDTLFIPTSPEIGAQLLRHLAAIDIWVKHDLGAAGPASGGRRVTVLATPEWYRPRLSRLAGRYAEGVLLPVPFARETISGSKLDTVIQAAGGRRPSSFDAIAWDALRSLAMAHGEARKSGQSASEALKSIELPDPVTPGLRFGARDALPGLFLLRTTRTGFAPAID